jgi:hypothetical protein
MYGGLDRRLSFCMGAKVCSGKAQNAEDAQRICKERMAKKSGCHDEPLHLDVDDVTVRVDGKEVILSAEIINKLCGCKRK